jgi:hypothetical protein
MNFESTDVTSMHSTSKYHRANDLTKYNVYPVKKKEVQRYNVKLNHANECFFFFSIVILILHSKQLICHLPRCNFVRLENGYFEFKTGTK